MPVVTNDFHYMTGLGLGISGFDYNTGNEFILILNDSNDEDALYWNSDERAYVLCGR